MSDQPSRWREMAQAMSGHIDERKAQMGGLANDAGVLLQAAGAGAGDAYGALTMPQRPIDAIMAGRGPAASGTDGAQMLEQMMMARNPGLEMTAAPTMGQTPEELGLVISDEWRARDDDRMAEMQGLTQQRKFKQAMEKAAYKLRMQEHVDDYGTPESQAAVKQKWREFHAAKAGT